MRHLHDGADDGCVVGVGVDVTHKRLVDFEAVDIESFEVGEAGIAGAEIINGEFDAELLEYIKLGKQVVYVFYQNRFREFQL